MNIEEAKKIIGDHLGIAGYKISDFTKYREDELLEWVRNIRNFREEEMVEYENN